MTYIEINLHEPLPAPAFESGTYVLVRDPARFWLGEPGHTSVGVVRTECDHHHYPKRVRVSDLRTGRDECALPEYLRLLPAGECMRDVDVAPLASDYPGLHPAAVAWLQQNTTPEARPELESGGDA